MITGNRFISKFFLIFILLISGCGGHISGNSDEGVTVDVSVCTDSIYTTYDSEPEKITVTVQCNTDDLFNTKCRLNNARITIGTYSYDIPINISMEANEIKSFELTVFSNSDKELEPFSYLRDVNPSTSETGWTSYSEILAYPESIEIGIGSEACTTDTTCESGLEYNPVSDSCEALPYCLEGTLNPDTNLCETPGPDCTGDFIYNAERDTCEASPDCYAGTFDPLSGVCETIPKETSTCSPVKSFSATLPDHTSGTVKVSDGSQNLEETAFGLLTGSGAGSISGNDLSFTFASPPTVDSLIYAMFLTPLQPLSSIPRGYDLKIAYKDILLTEENDFLIDASGDIYATLTGNVITPLKPFGFRDSPLVASYSGEPFNAYGGESIGSGNGYDSTFSLKTKYAPHVEGTFQVFTEKQIGGIQSYNPYSGEFVATFEVPPAVGEKIKASYVLSKVITPVIVEISANTGTYSFLINLEVSR